jgi:hypothetical protein
LILNVEENPRGFLNNRLEIEVINFVFLICNSSTNKYFYPVNFTCLSLCPSGYFIIKANLYCAKFVQHPAKLVKTGTIVARVVLILNILQTQILVITALGNVQFVLLSHIVPHAFPYTFLSTLLV